MACSLAEWKARSVARLHPNALVIGSDEVADIHEVILGKPGSFGKAVAQLRASSGNGSVFSPWR